MGTKKYITKTSEGDGQCGLSVYGFTQLKKPVPDSYKVGRDAQLQLAKVERDLFTDMEEKGSGNYIISGLSRKVSELDFTAFSFAIGQILYNQSYQSGNLNTNSGLKKREAKKVSRQVGFTMYRGEIITSLNDLCKLAYGVDSPDARQRKTMEQLINIIDATPVTIQYPNGSYDKSWLCRKVNERYTAEDGAIYYEFTLNPIFCSNVSKNFGELPQDITKRLSGATKRKTTAHYLLIRLLSIQAKGKAFTRSIDTLLKDLNLEEAYKKDKGRTEKQLHSIFETMRTIGIIDSYDTEHKIVRTKKSISKVTFHISTRGKLIGRKEPEEPKNK